MKSLVLKVMRSASVAVLLVSLVVPSAFACVGKTLVVGVMSGPQQQV